MSTDDTHSSPDWQIVDTRQCRWNNHFRPIPCSDSHKHWELHKFHCVDNLQDHRSEFRRVFPSNFHFRLWPSNSRKCWERRISHRLDIPDYTPVLRTALRPIFLRYSCNCRNLEPCILLRSNTVFHKSLFRRGDRCSLIQCNCRCLVPNRIL
jgi:hypothetical protein